MADEHHMINPREYQHYMHWARTLRLLDADPMLARLVATIMPARSSTIDCRLFATLKARVDATRQRLQTGPPFLDPPQHLAHGDITLAQTTTGPLRLTTAESVRGLLITGATGTGKTTFVLHLLTALINEGA